MRVTGHGCEGVKETKDCEGESIEEGFEHVHVFNFVCFTKLLLI